MLLGFTVSRGAKEEITVKHGDIQCTTVIQHPNDPNRVKTGRSRIVFRWQSLMLESSEVNLQWGQERKNEKKRGDGLGGF